MRVAITALLFGAVLTSMLSGQQAAFRAGVEAVRVDVSVTDGGRPVQGLTAADFATTDNGSPVSITSITVEHLPLRVVLVLDTSASVQGAALATLVQASRGLIEALRPADRIAVLGFSDRMKVVSGFEANRSTAIEALRRVHAGGSTDLYDALQVAFELVHMDDRAADARPLIVVCTDGVDTGSLLSGSDVLEAARRAGVVLDAIKPPGSSNHGLETSIDDLAEASGGRTWTARSEQDLKVLFTQTLTEMRDRYLLTFTPQAPVRQGWHDLKVRLRHAHGDVLARPGYYVEKNEP